MNGSMTQPNPVRNLPPNDPATIQNLSNLTLEEHYITFILYCNPDLPPNLSTTELRRGFRSVPRSDGKSFETLQVFQLLQKFEKGEISSWIALVTQLGVDPPDLIKGGSGQKLQQYGVRLKRWAHAFHIDAFFQYLMGNSHPYFTAIPAGPHSLFMTRDGVPADEDLALRALLPNLRPKRGRKKGHDDDNESIDTPSKRLRAGTPSTVDGRNSPRPADCFRVSQSPAPTYTPQQPPGLVHIAPAPPRSHQPQMYEHEQQLNDLFAVSRVYPAIGLDPTQASMPQHASDMTDTSVWPTLPARSHSDYPQSAIDVHPPSNAFGSPELNDGSRSAHPSAAGRANKSKKRGINTVSSSWSISSPGGMTSGNGAKVRGRPPGQRTMKQGQYENWSLKESIEVDQDIGQPNMFGSTEQRQPQAAIAQMQSSSMGQGQIRRPPTKKLSLQVPQQPSGNVRLATPPILRDQEQMDDPNSLPRVTLNDNENFVRPRNPTADRRERESTIERQRQRDRLFPSDRSQRRSSADFFKTIDDDASQQGYDDEYDDDGFDDSVSNSSNINWKQRAQILAKRLKQAQDELKRVKKAVLEAVM